MHYFTSLRTKALKPIYYRKALALLFGALLPFIQVCYALIEVGIPATAVAIVLEGAKLRQRLSQKTITTTKQNSMKLSLQYGRDFQIELIGDDQDELDLLFSYAKKAMELNPAKPASKLYPKREDFSAYADAYAEAADLKGAKTHIAGRLAFLASHLTDKENPNVKKELIVLKGYKDQTLFNALAWLIRTYPDIDFKVLRPHFSTSVQKGLDKAMEPKIELEDTEVYKWFKETMPGEQFPTDWKRKTVAQLNSILARRYFKYKAVEPVTFASRVALEDEAKEILSKFSENTKELLRK